MARTLIGHTHLLRNSAVVPTAATAMDTTNDHYVAATEYSKSRKMFIRATNTTAGAKIITIKAGAFQGNGQGDLTKSMAQNEVCYLGPLDSYRFEQSNGQIYVDLEAGMTGDITVVTVP